MNHRQIYDLLVQKCQTRTRTPDIYERHHIVPKSMGGTNAKSNIVFFTPREHYVAHHLLWKIHKNKQMFYAFWCMVTRMGRNDNSYRVTSRVYEQAKLEHRIMSSSTHRGKIPWNKGKIGVYSPETISKMSAARTGHVETSETKRKKSDSAKNRPMPAHIHSVPVKEKRRESNIAWRNNNQVICPHCNASGVKYNMERYHFDNCHIINPGAARESKSLGIKLKTHKCPHCNIETSMGNLKRWHLDKCKNKEEK